MRVTVFHDPVSIIGGLWKGKPEESRTRSEEAEEGEKGARARVAVLCISSLPAPAYYRRNTNEPAVVAKLLTLLANGQI